MITQLKNQDPFKPMDPSQYVGPARAVQLGVGPRGDQQEHRCARRTRCAATRCSMARRSSAAPSSPKAARSIDRARRRRSACPRRAPSKCPRARRACSSSSAIRPARPSSTQALDARAGLRGFTWDGTTDSGTAATAGAYKIEVIANVGGKNTSLNDQRRGARCRASRSIRPPARSCSTPTRSAKSP